MPQNGVRKRKRKKPPSITILRWRRVMRIWMGEACRKLNNRFLNT